jgi:hypothetical protein
MKIVYTGNWSILLGFNDTFSAAQVSDELEGMCKEVVVACFIGYCRSIYPNA